VIKPYPCVKNSQSQIDHILQPLVDHTLYNDHFFILIKLLILSINCDKMEIEFDKTLLPLIFFDSPGMPL